MKRSLPLFILLFFSFNSQAQYQYVPIPTDSANWNYGYGGKYHSLNFHLIVKGDDTTINSIKYTKLYYRESAPVVYPPGTFYNNEPIPNYANKPDSYHGGLREVNKKVYIKLTSGADTLDKIIYDFNLNIGDTMPRFQVPSKPENIIDKIDTVTINGIDRKRFISYGRNSNGSINYNFTQATVIEGIGSSTGLIEYSSYMYLNRWFTCFVSSSAWYIVDTQRCAYTYEYGTPTNIQTVSTQETINIYPNPTTDVVNIEAPTGTRITIYNSTGRMLLSKTSTALKEKMDINHLPSGLYIINLYNEQANLNERRKIMKL